MVPSDRCLNLFRQAIYRRQLRPAAAPRRPLGPANRTRGPAGLTLCTSNYHVQSESQALPLYSTVPSRCSCVRRQHTLALADASWRCFSNPPAIPVHACALRSVWVGSLLGTDTVALVSQPLLCNAHSRPFRGGLVPPVQRCALVCGGSCGHAGGVGVVDGISPQPRAALYHMRRAGASAPRFPPLPSRSRGSPLSQPTSVDRPGRIFALLATCRRGAATARRERVIVWAERGRVHQDVAWRLASLQSGRRPTSIAK